MPSFKHFFLESRVPMGQPLCQGLIYQKIYLCFAFWKSGDEVSPSLEDPVAFMQLLLILVPGTEGSSVSTCQARPIEAGGGPRIPTSALFPALSTSEAWQEPVPPVLVCSLSFPSQFHPREHPSRNAGFLRHCRSQRKLANM